MCNDWTSCSSMNFILIFPTLFCSSLFSATLTVSLMWPKFTSNASLYSCSSASLHKYFQNFSQHMACQKFCTCWFLHQETLANHHLLDIDKAFLMIKSALLHSLQVVAELYHIQHQQHLFIFRSPVMLSSSATIPRRQPSSIVSWTQLLSFYPYNVWLILSLILYSQNFQVT